MVFIKTEDETQEAWRKMRGILGAHGYAVGEMDEVMGYVAFKTDQKRQKLAPLTYGWAQYSLNISEDGDSTTVGLRGWYQADNLPAMSIRLYGAKGSLARRMWDQMQSIAERYEGAKLRFAKAD